MDNPVGRTRGLVPDGLHPWEKLHVVLGRGRLGHMTPLGPLYGIGLSQGGSVKGAHGLPMQSAPLPPPAPPLRPCIGARQTLFRSQDPDPQAPSPV